MKIRELYQSDAPGISIEIFPPKTPKADSALEDTLNQLARYQPIFVSCTYGAGGSTRDRTLYWCDKIRKQYALSATAHFTCIGASTDELRTWLKEAVANGVENIMALRGDPPKGQSTFKPVEGGLRYANELVSLIRSEFPELGIGVAGYPEVHPEATDAESDLANLKRKVDAGADAIYTQLFYDNEAFFKFQDRCRLIGIEVPIVPGIMPITEYARIKRITEMCGALFPKKLSDDLQRHETDPSAQFRIGVEYAIRQSEKLIEAGAPGIHYYALNKSQACKTILEALGVEPVSLKTAT